MKILSIAIFIGIAISLCGCSDTGLVDKIYNQGMNAIYEANFYDEPFSYDLESARSYLLEQMENKYGEPFEIAGDETLKNYGPVAGASYSCEVTPVANSDYVAKALVSQTQYKDVRDNYAGYYFKDEAEAAPNEMCSQWDYIKGYEVKLDAPSTRDAWQMSDGLYNYMYGSNAAVHVTVYLEKDLSNEAYADMVMRMLSDIYNLDSNISLHVREEKGRPYADYIYQADVMMLSHPDSSSNYSRSDVMEEIENFEVLR